MPNKFLNGYSIVELLVVISIISILASVGLVSYINTNKYARDQHRIRDLHSLKQALELYRSEFHSYPPSSKWQIQNKTPLVGPAPDHGDIIYIKAEDMPQDPLTTNPPYRYQALPIMAPPCDNTTKDTTCTNFCLYAHLEGSSPSDKPGGCDFLPGTYTYALTSF